MILLNATTVQPNSDHINPDLKDLEPILVKPIE